MNQNEIKFFFECLGEIWRDIPTIEFLMRCAIAKKEGEERKFPTPPYTKGRVYKDYPKSFSHLSFKEITGEFNKYFPKLILPQELIELRNAMAHGVIAKINRSEVEQLVKFREVKDKAKDQKELRVEFSMSLDPGRIAQLRQSLKELRRYITQEVDKNK